MNWKEQFTNETGEIANHWKYHAGNYEKWLESKLTEKTEANKGLKAAIETNGNINSILKSQLKEAREENKKLFESSQPSLYKQLKEERQKREEAEAKLKAINERMPEDTEIRNAALEMDEKEFEEWWWNTVYKEI